MASSVNVSGIVPESITDGPGIRFTIFVQGCVHNCEGCHNRETWTFEGGIEMDIDKVFSKIMGNPLLSGVTFSGGEPFCQPRPLGELAKKIKQANLEIAVYSGYTFEELLVLAKENEDIEQLLGLCDILIDGRFVIAEKTLSLKFRGSKNQRVIDLKKSLEENKAVLETTDRWNNV